MSEEIKEKVNNDTDNEEGLSQEKFAVLFKNLDEAYIKDMLERAGTSEDVPSETEADIKAEKDDVAGEGTTVEMETGAQAEKDDAVEEGIAVETEPDADIAASAEDVSSLSDVTDEGLLPEHIGHLLQVLGEDVINDMLRDAGMEIDGLPTEEAPRAGIPTDSVAGKGAGNSAGHKSGNRKGRRLRRFLLLAIFAGIILMIFAVNQISMNVTLNSDDPIQYSEQADEISALEGSLIVNDVSVSVPTDANEEYSISYSWAEDDAKYPSVPQAITAVYPGEESEKLYTISLYRSETVKKKSMPKGKKASNWFDDWEVVSEGDILQKPLKSGSINGFYIYPQMNEEGTGTASDYNNYSYYFAVKERGGVSIYVIEGVCLDETIVPEFSRIMDECIKSITIKSENQETDSQKA